MLQQNPIRKEPITLTESIPKGKECSIRRCTHVEIPKRNTVPIAPPVISSKTFVITIYIFSVFFPGLVKDPGKMVNDLGSQLLIGRLELPQETNIVFGEHAQVFYLVFQIGNTLDTHSQRVA